MQSRGSDRFAVLHCPEARRENAARRLRVRLCSALAELRCQAALHETVGRACAGALAHAINPPCATSSLVVPTGAAGAVPECSTASSAAWHREACMTDAQLHSVPISRACVRRGTARCGCSRSPCASPLPCLCTAPAVSKYLSSGRLRHEEWYCLQGYAVSCAHLFVDWPSASRPVRVQPSHSRFSARFRSARLRRQPPPPAESALAPKS